MLAPSYHRIKDPNKAFEVNNDPAKLDQMYIKFLGKGGDKMLTEDVKWLAITHKSFDQGRRGFNDRLAFFGRRILQLQATLSLLHSPIATQTQFQDPDPYDRELFQHPALEGLPNLDNLHFGSILPKERIARFAAQMGIPEVTRWKPKNPANLQGSGIEMVMASSVYAIVGAIALHKGGDVAGEVARERVLKLLGIS